MKSDSMQQKGRWSIGVVAAIMSATPFAGTLPVRAKTMPLAPTQAHVTKKVAHKSKYDTAIHRIDFNGVVTHIAADGHSLIVVDGKRRMTVRYQAAGSFRKGQKVAVSGTLFEKYIVASKITRR
jgi:cytochrome c-type biogenesis protein CcmE